MPNYIVLDFAQAPPAQGGLASDHIPPATYALVVDKAEAQTARTGRQMVVVTLKVAEGEYAGKRLVERFVVPGQPEDSHFGLQRFHAFLVGVGFSEQKGKAKVNLDGLRGKKLLADVDDEEVPATGSYPARVASRPFSFYPLQPKAEQPTPAQAPTPIRKVEQPPLPEPDVEAMEPVEALEEQATAALDELMEEL